MLMYPHTGSVQGALSACARRGEDKAMHTRSYFVSVASAMAFFASAGFCQAADPGAAPGSNSPSNAAQAAVTTPRGQALGASTATQQLSLKAMLDSYKPYPTPQLSALPQEAHSLIDPLAADNTVAPKIIAGMPGPKTVERAAGVAEPAIAASDVAQNSITPFDYGRTSLSTVYHYTDRLLDSELADDFPYRTVGWLVFVASNGGSYRCTAQLIGRSIGVTAGHCVHDGGNKAAGWIRSATFYPGYPYLGMSAPIYWVNTTSGWYNSGNLDAGYDVGVFTLRKRTGTSTELGAYTGYVGFCVSNCLQKYWYLTQLGYPGNYYSGTYMTQGEHLEVSDTRDYLYGSGMQGGSSGGGHFANLGDLASYTSGSLGYWPYRNVIFATTSWGYTDASIKIQGASTLSGPNNSNNFKGLYNGACTQARALHGVASCSPLP